MTAQNFWDIIANWQLCYQPSPNLLTTLLSNIMDPNTQESTPNMSDGNMGYPQHTTQQEQMSQPERMTGNHVPTEINPNEPQPREFDDQQTRHQREIDLPDTEHERKEEKGYAEEPTEEYIPEIHGNEKYQKNYQDDEQPPVTE